MKVLITGGAGFIGRWVTKLFLDNGMNVFVIDNLSNSSKDNIKEFLKNKNFKFVKGDIRNRNLIRKIFKNKFDICVHLAAKINVQESIDNPREDFEVNVLGTFNLLEEALKCRTKFVFVSTCMIYSKALNDSSIDERHPLLPKSPYAASKISAENLARSFYYAYGLPVVILRPFNVYGPYQKSNQEGGVVTIFLKNKINNKNLRVYGNGEQTRDFIYVEDCAEFIYKASISDNINGEVMNAGSGNDIKIKDLARLIVKDENKIKFVEHIHPQSEIIKLRCDNSKARRLLDWSPKISLNEGIKRFENWMKNG